MTFTSVDAAYTVGSNVVQFEVDHGITVWLAYTTALLDLDVTTLVHGDLLTTELPSLLMTTKLPDAPLTTLVPEILTLTTIPELNLRTEVDDD